MSKVVVIGAGGVGHVVAHKCAQRPDVFSEIVLASRTVARCDAVARSVAELTGRQLRTAAVDADDARQVTALLEAERPALVFHVALPYQDFAHHGRLSGGGR